MSVYEPINATVYGRSENRVKPLVVQHLPLKDALTVDTVDESPQIFVSGINLYYYVDGNFYPVGGSSVTTARFGLEDNTATENRAFALGNSYSFWVNAGDPSYDLPESEIYIASNIASLYSQQNNQQFSQIICKSDQNKISTEDNNKYARLVTNSDATFQLTSFNAGVTSANDIFLLVGVNTELDYIEIGADKGYTPTDTHSVLRFYPGTVKYDFNNTGTYPNGNYYAPISVNGVFADNSGNIDVPISSLAHVVFTAVSGGGTGFNRNTYQIVNPSGGSIASYEFQFPTIGIDPDLADGDTIEITSTGTITALTYTVGTVVHGMSSMIAGSYQKFMYDAGTTTWYGGGGNDSATGGGGGESLDATLAIGDTGTSKNINIQTGVIKAYNTLSTTNAALSSAGYLMVKTGGAQAYIAADYVTTDDRFYELPVFNVSGGNTKTIPVSINGIFADNAGNITLTGLGGTPAGSNTQIQYNNSGAFGASANLTYASNVLTIDRDNIGITSTNALMLLNNQAATVSLNQWTPSLILGGSSWLTSGTPAAKNSRWKIEGQTSNGTISANNTLTFSHTDDGTLYTSVMTLSSGPSGALTVPRGIATGGNGFTASIFWSNNAPVSFGGSGGANTISIIQNLAIAKFFGSTGNFVIMNSNSGTFPVDPVLNTRFSIYNETTVYGSGTGSSVTNGSAVLTGNGSAAFKYSLVPGETITYNSEVKTISSINSNTSLTMNSNYAANATALNILRSSVTQSFSFFSNGKMGIRNTAPTAFLHLPAGYANAEFAPLKFTAGTNLTTPENGAVEYDGSHLYITISGTRYQLDQQSVGGGGGGGVETFQSLTPGATVTWSISAKGHNTYFTINQDSLLSMSGDADGEEGNCIITQNGTGGWKVQVPSGDVIIDGARVIGGLTNQVDLPAAAGSQAMLSYIKKGSVRYWSKNFYW